MKERSILFSGKMVEAILDGRKTQTRRVMKPQPDSHVYEIKCPYGQPGDRLYVKETHLIEKIEFFSGYFYADILYKADNGKVQNVSITNDEYMKFNERKYPHRITSGLFMYRSLSRINLEITNIRIERLQDITEEDARSEGCPHGCANALNWYGALWNFINEKRGYGWDLNPWVWVIEFRRV
jgi:hypothetical protein